MSGKLFQLIVSDPMTEEDGKLVHRIRASPPQVRSVFSVMQVREVATPTPAVKDTARNVVVAAEHDVHPWLDNYMRSVGVEPAPAATPPAMTGIGAGSGPVACYPPGHGAAAGGGGGGGLFGAPPAPTAGGLLAPPEMRAPGMLPGGARPAAAPARELRQFRSGHSALRAEAVAEPVGVSVTETPGAADPRKLVGARQRLMDQFGALGQNTNTAPQDATAFRGLRVPDGMPVRPALDARYQRCSHLRHHCRRPREPPDTLRPRHPSSAAGMRPPPRRPVPSRYRSAPTRPTRSSRISTRRPWTSTTTATTRPMSRPSTTPPRTTASSPRPR